MSIIEQRSPEALQYVPRPIVAWSGHYANGDEIASQQPSARATALCRGGGDACAHAK